MGNCHYPVGLVDSRGGYVYRPCGQCIGCRLEYSRGWAMRCVHEASLHKDNSFLTLTYNNENLPEDRSIYKSHLQLFIKRFRNAITERIRYFACGEYGDLRGRPHYHVIIFGYMPNDTVLLEASKFRSFQSRWHSGEDFSIYKSSFIEKLWTKGFITVGNVSYESAAYVARYATKKVTGKDAQQAYKGKLPEFALMSRSPGIGSDWIAKYKTDIYPKDYVTHKGQKLRPIRFYDERYKETNPKGFEEVKKKRQKFQERYGENPAKDGMSGYNKDRFVKSRTKSLKRSLDNDN